MAAHDCDGAAAAAGAAAGAAAPAAVSFPPAVVVDSSYRVTTAWGYTIAFNRYVLRRPAPSASAAERQNISIIGSTTPSPAQSQPRTVVFLSHANGFCKELWEPALAELQALLSTVSPTASSTSDAEDDDAHGLVCYAWDLHCHGQSDVIPPPADPGIGSYRWRAHGVDLSNVLDFAVGLEQKRQASSPVVSARSRALRLVGIGHSMGASNLVGLQLHRPGVFHSLMLVEPVMPPLKFTRAQSDAVPNPLRDGAKRRRNVFPDDRAFIRSYFGDAKRFGSWDPRAVDAYVRGAFRRVPARPAKPNRKPPPLPPATAAVAAAGAEGSESAAAATDANNKPAAGPKYELELACPPAVESEFYATGTLHGMYFELDRLVCPGLFVLVTAKDSDMYIDAFHNKLCASLTNNGVQAARHDHYAAAKSLLYRRWAVREPAGGHLLVHTRPRRTAELMAHVLFRHTESAAALNDPYAVDLFPPPSQAAADKAQADVDALMESLRKRNLPTSMPVEHVAFAAPRGAVPVEPGHVSPATSHATQLRAKL